MIFNKNFEKIILISLIILISGFGYFIFLKKNKIKFNWIKNASQMYKFEATYDIKISPFQNFKNVSHNIFKFKGILNFKVFDIQDDKVYLGFQVAPIKIYENDEELPELKNLYGVFFLAIFKKDGTPVKFFLPDKINKNSKKLVTDTILGFQTILKNNKKSWNVLEKHSTGTYEANYKILKNGKIFKKKIKYLTVNKKFEGFTNNITIKIPQSKNYILLSKKKSWIKKYNGLEILEFYSEKKLFIISKNEIKLKLIPFHPDKSLPIWKENRKFSKIIKDFSSNKSKSISYWDTTNRKILSDKIKKENINLNDLLDKIENSNSMENKINLLQKLKDYLIVFPEKAEKIPKILLNDEYSDETKSFLIHALELAGTDSAQDALIEIVKDENQSYMNRSRGIVAMSGLENPNDNVISFLENVSNFKNEDLKNTALLALGSLSNTLNKNGESTKTKNINNFIEEYIKKGNNEDDVIFSLKAMGNTADEKFLSIIEQYLDSDSNEIRFNAVKALRNFKSNEVLNLLMDEYKTQNSSGIKKEILKILTGKGNNIKVINFMKENLLKEKNPDIRKKIIKFLGNNKKKYPEIEKILKEQLKNETSYEVKKSIIRAINKQ